MGARVKENCLCHRKLKEPCELRILKFESIPKLAVMALGASRSVGHTGQHGQLKWGSPTPPARSGYNFELLLRVPVAARVRSKGYLRSWQGIAHVSHSNFNFVKSFCKS